VASTPRTPRHRDGPQRTTSCAGMINHHESWCWIDPEMLMVHNTVGDLRLKLPAPSFAAKSCAVFALVPPTHAIPVLSCF
jgi:hypothetical protein